MTDDQIIEMATQAGAKQMMSPTKYENIGLFGNGSVIAFARLIAEKQREDDALIAEEGCAAYAGGCAAAIRNSGGAT